MCNRLFIQLDSLTNVIERLGCGTELSEVPGESSEEAAHVATNKNQFQRARTIIRSLIEELPHDSIVNRIEFNRALSTGVIALEQIEARLARRAHLPGNVGRTWDKTEEATLIAAHKLGESVADIATPHGRTVWAIEARPKG